MKTNRNTTMWGTKNPDGTVTIQSGETSGGKLRCPVCREIAHPSRRQDGTTVNRCPKCRREWVSRVVG